MATVNASPRIGRLPWPTICDRCECPLPPHRFVNRWPLNAGQCRCDTPASPVPVAEDALRLIHGAVTELRELRHRERLQSRRLHMESLAAAGLAKVYCSYDRPAVQYCDVLAVDEFGADVRWHKNGRQDRMPLTMLHPAPRRPEAA